MRPTCDAGRCHHHSSRPNSRTKAEPSCHCCCSSCCLDGHSPCASTAPVMTDWCFTRTGWGMTSMSMLAGLAASATYALYRPVMSLLDHNPSPIALGSTVLGLWICMQEVD